MPAGRAAAVLLTGIAWGVVLPGWLTAPPVEIASDKSGKLRVIHFGDSHTAADNLQLSIREHLQQASGSGGIGIFLPCATPHPAQQHAWTSHCSKHWTLQTRPTPPPAIADEYLGLPGMLLETDATGESIFVDAPFSTAARSSYSNPAAAAFASS